MTEPTVPLKVDPNALERIFSVLERSLPVSTPTNPTWAWLKVAFFPVSGIALFSVGELQAEVWLSLAGLLIVLVWMLWVGLWQAVQLEREIKRAHHDELSGLQATAPRFLSTLSHLAVFDNIHLEYVQALVDWRIKSLDARVGSLLGGFRQTGVVLATVTVGAVLVSLSNTLQIPPLWRIGLFISLVGFSWLTLHFQTLLERLHLHSALLLWARTYRK